MARTKYDDSLTALVMDNTERKKGRIFGKHLDARQVKRLRERQERNQTKGPHLPKQSRGFL